MTREEAIDIIKCLAWHTRPNEEDVEQAIKALERQPSEDTIDRQAAIRIASGYCHLANIAYELSKLPTVQPEQRWIPVSERMPEEDCRNGENQQKSDYLLMSVYNEEDGVTIVDYGYTVDGNWYSDATYQFIPPGWEVIAWMPLPEPYKPHESEE